MRILMLNNEFPPLGGGTGVVNQNILQEWSRYDEIEVDLVTSSRNRNQAEYAEITPQIRLHKVPVDNRNIHHSSNRELLTYTWHGWRFARGLIQRQGYDICLAWAGVPAGGMAMWLKWEFGLPYVVSLQGPDVPGFEERYTNAYRVLTPFIRQVWRGAAELAACSEQHRALAYKTDPNIPIQVIANGVNTAFFSPAANRKPQIERGDDRPVRLICSGRLIERKGQQYLLPAVAQLYQEGHQLSLALAGTGDNETSLRTQVNQLGLDEIVTFAGFVTWKKMPALYRQSDIFVLPSFHEGMSIALLEAMATGLPAVVTDTGGTRELIQGNGLVVEWADVEGLANALRELVANPQLRADMAIRSRQIAQQYSWDQVAQRYLDLCTQAARRRSQYFITRF